MTYGNYSGQGVYRSHLDSKDFMNFLRWTACISLTLSAAFSIRGNVLGLSTFLSGGWLYTFCIAAGITITSSLLSMLSIFRLPGLSRSGRILIGIAAAALFASSVMLTLIGFNSGEKTVKQLSFFENPELGAANQVLFSILQRQKSFDLTDSEKRSLMAREKEQRRRIFEIEDRIRKEQKSETSIEAAVGSEAKLARVIFACAPDLAILVLSPIIVLLFGMSGVGSMQGSGQGQALEQRIIYLPASQGQGQAQNQGQAKQVQYYQASQPASRQPEAQRQPVAVDQGGGNGHIGQGQGQGREQLSFGWDPFGGGQ